MIRTEISVARLAQFFVYSKGGTKVQQSNGLPANMIITLTEQYPSFMMTAISALFAWQFRSPFISRVIIIVKYSEIFTISEPCSASEQAL